MSAPLIEYAVWEDSGTSLMARITGNDAANIEQADVSTIAYSVFSVTTASDGTETFTAAGTGTLTVSTVVFDTLQTDARWTKDSTGYNFRWDVPASIHAAGGTLYQIEIKFTPPSGEAWHVVARSNVSNLARS